ncbi:MAG: hypothetical protein ACD_79C00020G0009 [uncultured bacterium]|nr:MAG: hypothetical protein ACD_79C00020G0009 [uncultured bacterium]
MNIIKEIKFLSEKLDDTKKIGLEIAKILNKGDTVGFIGNLGAGKTFLIKSICSFFNVPEHDVTSPSFTLVNEYSGNTHIIHLDTYRLNNDIEFEMLDLDFYASKHGIIFIEWFDKIQHLYNHKIKTVEIEILDENKRSIIYREWDA